MTLDNNDDDDLIDVNLNCYFHKKIFSLINSMCTYKQN